MRRGFISDMQERVRPNGGHVCLLQLIQPLLVEHRPSSDTVGLLSKKGLK